METTCPLCPQASCQDREQAWPIAEQPQVWQPGTLAGSQSAPGPAQHAGDGVPGSPGGLGVLQAEQIHAYGLAGLYRAQGLGQREAPRRAPAYEGLEGQAGDLAPLSRKPPGPQGIPTSPGRNRDSDQEEPCGMLVSETGAESIVTMWAQGPRQGCQGPALRVWGLREGAGSQRVCEDGVWAPREEAAARMT